MEAQDAINLAVAAALGLLLLLAVLMDKRLSKKGGK
jgi:hypothetical protein